MIVAFLIRASTFIVDQRQSAIVYQLGQITRVVTEPGLYFRIPLLQNGTIDIECGSTTNNSERGKQVAFAINYFYTGTRLLVRSNSAVKDMDDLAGKTVVSTTGTTNMLVMRKLNSDRKRNFDHIGRAGL